MRNYSAILDYAVASGFCRSMKDGNQYQCKYSQYIEYLENAFQSAFSMPTEEKRMQEKASLVNVKDSFKKIILVKDVMNVTRDEDGITTMSIYDFLLKDNSLEL